MLHYREGSDEESDERGQADIGALAQSLKLLVGQAQVQLGEQPIFQDFFSRH
ncbi:hypothetical protein ACHAWF_017958 [Thalassiosira exigua]